LFDLADYERVAYDPYWDEIVLDTKSTVEDKTGQPTLIYDASHEPPDPDDYPNLGDYHQAWDLWVKNHPDHHGFSPPQNDGDLSSMEGVSESSLQPYKDDSLTPPNEYIEPVLDPYKDDSLTPHGCITEYSPRGGARGGKRYFRYSYKHRGRVHHHHIPGGNCSSKLAQARAQKIREAIAAGKEPEQILKIIKFR